MDDSETILSQCSQPCRNNDKDMEPLIFKTAPVQFILTLTQILLQESIVNMAKVFACLYVQNKYLHAELGIIQCGTV